MSIWRGLPPLSEHSNRPLYRHISEIISEFIKSKQFPPGTLMPAESELMTIFGVSRTTIRQAVQQLVSNGMAKKIQGKGTFVVEPKSRGQVRFFSSIERWLAVQGLNVQNQLLTNDVGMPPDWALGLGYPAGEPARIIRRLKIMEDKPLALEHRVLPPDIAALLNVDDIQKSALFRALDYHPVAHADRVHYSITAILADDVQAGILQVASGSPLIIRNGIYRNDSGRTIMAAQLAFVADRLDFRLEFKRHDDYWAITDEAERSLNRSD